MRFMLTELRRSGATVILNARLELVDTAAGNGLQVRSAFDDGTFQGSEDGGTETGDVFDGVALIDPEGKKKYFVARDGTVRVLEGAEQRVHPCRRAGRVGRHARRASGRGHDRRPRRPPLRDAP